MMAIKRVFFFIILVIPSLAYGDWAEDFFGSLGSRSDVTYPDMQTQGSYTFTGGGWSWNGGSNATLQAFSVSAPSVTAGCGGIDINLGAFQLLDEDELVAFLEALLAQAPGYAFELAMQILCPSCLDIMNTLKQMANVLNGLQFDACGTLKLAGGYIEKAATNWGNNEMGEGRYDNYKKAMENFNATLQQVNKYIEKAFNCATGKGCPKKIYLSKQTLQQLVVETMDEMNSSIVSNVKNLYNITSDDDLAMFLGSFLGDVVVVNTTNDNSTLSDNDTSKTGVTKQFVPLIPASQNYRSLVYKMTYGTSSIPSDISESASEAYETVNVNIASYNFEGSGDNKELNQSRPFGGYTEKTITTTQGQANNYLNTLYKAFQGRGTGLTEDTLVFLASFKTPVYKILNLYSVDDDTLKHFIDSFRVLAGAQMTYEIMSALATSVRASLGVIGTQIAAADVDFIDKFMSMSESISLRMSLMQEEAYKMYVDAYDQFQTKMQDNDYLQKLQKMQRAMMARHPVTGYKTFAPSLGN